MKNETDLGRDTKPNNGEGGMWGEMKSHNLEKYDHLYFLTVKSLQPGFALKLRQRLLNYSPWTSCTVFTI